MPAGEAYGEWFPTMPSEPPLTSPTTVVSAIEPVKVRGVWVYGWSVRDKTEEELSNDRQRLIDTYTAFIEGKYDSGLALNGYPWQTRTAGAADTLNGLGETYFELAGGSAVIRGAAVPTVGVWPAGDDIYRTAPAAAGEKGVDVRNSRQFWNLEAVGGGY